MRCQISCHGCLITAWNKIVAYRKYTILSNWITHSGDLRLCSSKEIQNYRFYCFFPNSASLIILFLYMICNASITLLYNFLKCKKKKKKIKWADEVFAGCLQ